MPTYEFICEECGSEFSEFLVPGEKIEKYACPACSSAKVKRLVSKLSTVGVKSGNNEPDGESGCCSPGGCGCSVN